MRPWGVVGVLDKGALGVVAWVCGWWVGLGVLLLRVVGGCGWGCWVVWGLVLLWSFVWVVVFCWGCGWAPGGVFVVPGGRVLVGGWF